MLGITKEGQAKFVSFLVVLVMLTFIVFAVNESLTNETNQDSNGPIINGSIPYNLSDNITIGVGINGSPRNESDTININMNNASSTNNTSNSINNPGVEQNITTARTNASDTVDIPLDTLNSSNNTNQVVILEEAGDESSDDPYVQEYLKHISNHPHVKFKNIPNGDDYSALMKAGNVEVELQKVAIGNKNYTIDLVTCNHESKDCSFRVNGNLAKGLSHKNNKTYKIHGGYWLKINSILFDYCDEKKVCDYYYDSYDLVNISIFHKGASP